LIVPAHVEWAKDADRRFVHAQPPPRFGLRWADANTRGLRAWTALPSPYPTVAVSLEAPPTSTVSGR
jgi:hypothetical protein